MKLRVYEKKSLAEILPWFHMALTDMTERKTDRQTDRQTDRDRQTGSLTEEDRER